MAEITSIFVPQADFITSTIIGAITNASTSFTIGSGLSLDTTGGFLQIDYDSLLGLGVDGGPETIAYTSYNSGTGAVSGVTRAQASTTSVAHANGATIQCGPSSKYLLNGSLLGYASIVTNFTSTAASAITDITNLSIAVSVPTLASTRFLVVEGYGRFMTSSGSSGTGVDFIIREGSTQLAYSSVSTAAISQSIPAYVKAYLQGVSAGTHTYKLSFFQANSGTFTLGAASGAPAFISAYLI